MTNGNFSVEIPFYVSEYHNESIEDGILLNDVHTQVRIDDFSTYTSTGKFNFTKSGLYMGSIWVLASNQDKYFFLRNDIILAHIHTT